MTEDELRTLVRQAIQRHVGAEPIRPAEPIRSAEPIRLKADTTLRSISFAQYSLARAADDTMCLIEPAVACNHCGFCKCHGH